LYLKTRFNYVLHVIIATRWLVGGSGMRKCVDRLENHFRRMMIPQLSNSDLGHRFVQSSLATSNDIDTKCDKS
jgi:hypothetical protein